MNIKRIVSASLSIFVFFSIAFWVYKEFVQRSHGKTSTIMEMRTDNTSPTQNLTFTNENIAVKEIIPKPEKTTQRLQTSPQTANSKVIAYYFHGTHRCSTCLTIERYSHEAIEQYFSRELQDGKLEFKPVNVEEPENRHYILNYQLFTRSLVLVRYKDDKQQEWKNLTEVWSYVRNKEKFYQYVKDEIENFLKDTL